MVLQESDSALRDKIEITSTGDAGSTSGLGLGAIVGIAAAALVPLVATAALLMWRWRYIQATSLSEAPVRNISHQLYFPVVIPSLFGRHASTTHCAPEPIHDTHTIGTNSIVVEAPAVAH